MNPTQSPTNPHAAGKAAHTPTPWQMPTLDDPSTITAFRVFQDGAMHPCGVAVICKHGSDSERNANAAFIVRACNSHAALVEALKAIREEATAYPEGGEDCFKYSLSLIAEKARAAIARATGQGGGE